MKVLKKIGRALLITIALVVAAVVLTAPFALIENPLTKAIIALVYLFVVVLAISCCLQNLSSPAAATAKSLQ